MSLPEVKRNDDDDDSDYDDKGWGDLNQSPQFQFYVRWFSRSKSRGTVTQRTH